MNQEPITNQNGEAPSERRGEAVDLNRLVRHLDSREESLEAEYELHKGMPEMKCIISGQLLEIKKMRRVFLPNK